jgi:hypothetical protein
VLFLVFGSSGAGKTTALNALRGRVGPRVAVHDFDEIGVPPGADEAWRRDANEEWVQRALAYQAEGIDLLLAGQTPYTELLAAPSAAELAGVAACLLDCDEQTRVARLRRRGMPPNLDDLLQWAGRLRTEAAADRVYVVDTTALTPDEVADRLAAWVTASASASS